LSLNPITADIEDLLRSEAHNHLDKVAKIYATSGKLIVEYKTWPNNIVGKACLKREFSYDDSVNTEVPTGEQVSVAIWTSTLQALAVPALTGSELNALIVEDGAVSGTKVADICSIGGKPPFTFAITADPSSKFTLTNGGELSLSATAAIADVSYSVTIETTDDAGVVASTVFTITVVPFAQSPVPIATSGSIEVLQAVHDFLNLNANIQINDIDISTTNPIPVDSAPVIPVNATTTIIAVGTSEVEVTAATNQTALKITNLDNGKVFYSFDTGVSSSNAFLNKGDELEVSLYAGSIFLVKTSGTNNLQVDRIIE